MIWLLLALVILFGFWRGLFKFGVLVLLLFAIFIWSATGY